MLEKFTYDGKKETSPPQKLSANNCKIAQIFVTSLLLVDVLNDWPQFICLCKKVNNCVHCN